MFNILYKAKTHHKKHKLFSAVIYLIAILSPLFTLPQLLQIWQHKQVQGLSLLTWSGYAIGSLLWAIYGVVHKEKPIALTNLLLFIIDSAIAVSILIYQ